MEVEAAKLIGAGLATIALAGAGIGIGKYLLVMSLQQLEIHQRLQSIW